MAIVQDTIPLPTARSNGAPIKYNFQDLKKEGDSLFFETPINKQPTIFLSQVLSAFRARGLDFKITSRRVKEDGRNGVRVWRI